MKELLMTSKKVFIVCTTAFPTINEDVGYFGNVLLVTQDEAKADKMVKDFLAEKPIKGLNYNKLKDHFGVTKFEMTLDKPLNTTTCS